MGEGILNEIRTTHPPPPATKPPKKRLPPCFDRSSKKEPTHPSPTIQSMHDATHHRPATARHHRATRDRNLLLLLLNESSGYTRQTHKELTHSSSTIQSMHDDAPSPHHRPPPPSHPRRKPSWSLRSPRNGRPSCFSRQTTHCLRRPHGHTRPHPKDDKNEMRYCPHVRGVAE